MKARLRGMYVMTFVAASVALAGPSIAQSNWQTYGNVYAGQAVYGMRAAPYPMLTMPGLAYQGVRGYSQSGWEYGRMQSMERYGADPGPWPGWRGAFGR